MMMLATKTSKIKFSRGVDVLAIHCQSRLVQSYLMPVRILNQNIIEIVCNGFSMVYQSILVMPTTNIWILQLTKDSASFVIGISQLITNQHLRLLSLKYSNVLKASPTRMRSTQPTNQS